MDPFDDDDNHDCCLVMESSMLDMQNNLAKRMAGLESTMNKQFKELQRNLFKASEHIKILMDMKEVSEPKNTFPLKSEEALADIDKKISESPSTYIPLFERMLMPEGIIRNLEKLISRELVLKMNFHGTSNKIAFDKYIYLNKVLYEATTSIDRNFNDYKKNMRTAFSRVKTRAYKLKSRKSIMEANDSLTQNSDELT